MTTYGVYTHTRCVQVSRCKCECQKCTFSSSIHISSSPPQGMGHLYALMKYQERYCGKLFPWPLEDQVTSVYGKWVNIGPHTKYQAAHSYLHGLKPDLRLSHISLPLDPIEVSFEAGDRLHWIARKVCLAVPRYAVIKQIHVCATLSRPLGVGLCS